MYVWWEILVLNSNNRWHFFQNNLWLNIKASEMHWLKSIYIYIDIYEGLFPDYELFYVISCFSIKRKKSKPGFLKIRIFFGIFRSKSLFDYSWHWPVGSEFRNFFKGPLELTSISGGLIKPAPIKTHLEALSAQFFHIALIWG